MEVEEHRQPQSQVEEARNEAANPAEIGPEGDAANNQENH